MSFSGGKELFGGRGHVVAGIDYNRNDGVGTIYTRDWASVEPGNNAVPLLAGANRPAGTPANLFLPNIELATATFGSVINTASGPAGASAALNQTAFRTDGSTYALVRGPVYGGQYMGGVTTNYGASPLGNWPLKSPKAAGAALARFNFDFDNDTSAFAELSYGRSEAVARTAFYVTSSIILIDNPFLPTESATR